MPPTRRSTSTPPRVLANRIITDDLDDAAAAHAGQGRRDHAAGDDHLRASWPADRYRVALGLLELGVRPGDVVSFQLPNWIEFLVLHYAATRIGAVNNPLIPIYRDREVGFMVGLAESKVLVIPQEFRGYDYPAMVERLRPQLAGAAARAGRRPGLASWEEFAAPRGRSAATRPTWPRLRPGPERRHAADLHLRHHRRAEGRGAHPQHPDRRERAAAGPARRRPGQRDPHGLDVRAPHRLPLRRAAAGPGGRRHRGLPGRLERRASSSAWSRSTGSPTPRRPRRSCTTP